MRQPARPDQAVPLLDLLLMARGIWRDHSTRLPLELRLDVLGYLSREDLLRASSVSHVWRVAGRMDPRFFVHACACAEKREFTTIRRQSGAYMAKDSFEHARQFDLRVALVYDTSGCAASCGCARPKHPARNDWQAFSRHVQPISGRIVKLHILTNSKFPEDGLFDVDLPALRDLCVQAKRAKQLRPPAAVPNTIFSGGAAALRFLHLVDLVVDCSVPAFSQVTALTLQFTDYCGPPVTHIPLSDAFPNLLELTIFGSMDIVSEYDDPVNWFSAIHWSPTLYAQLSSLSMCDVPEWDWGNGHIPKLPAAVSLRFDDLPDEWHDHAGSFLETVLLESTPDGEPRSAGAVRALMYSKSLTAILVLYRPASETSPHSAVRVLVMPDPQQIYSAAEFGLHHPHCNHLVSLTVRFDPFACYDLATIKFPLLQALTLLFDCNIAKYSPNWFESDELNDGCLDVLDCAALDHEHLMAIDPHFPHLKIISLASHLIRHRVSSNVLWRLLHTMAVFMPATSCTIANAIALNICGLIVPKDEEYRDIVRCCTTVHEDPDAIYSAEEINKWTGPDWHREKL